MSALPRKQRGAATVIAAMLLVTVILTIGLSTLRMSSTDVTDSSLQRHATEALFLAETGLERAAQYLANGSSCDATLVMGSPDTFGNGDYQITSATLVGSLCQVQVTGRRLYGNVAQATRVIEGGISVGGGGGVLEPPGNFDDYSCIIFWCWQDDWTVDPWYATGGWSINAGPDGSPALWVNKTSTGGPMSTTANINGMTPIVVTAPTTVTFNYDYRVISTGQRSTLTITLSSGGTNYSNSIQYNSSTTGFQSGSLDISITGSGSITLDDLELTLSASGGQPKTLIIDNLEISGSGGGGSVQVVGWREIIA